MSSSGGVNAAFLYMPRNSRTCFCFKCNFMLLPSRRHIFDVIRRVMCQLTERGVNGLVKLMCRQTRNGGYGFQLCWCWCWIGGSSVIQWFFQRVFTREIHVILIKRQFSIKGPIRGWPSAKLFSQDWTEQREIRKSPENEIAAKLMRLNGNNCCSPCTDPDPDGLWCSLFGLACGSTTWD